MKKLFVLVIGLVMIFSFAGCGDGHTSKGGEEILTASEYWYYFDEVTGETEKMSFSDDGTFYWGCECGEPIGDSDLLELYDYDAKNKIIKLYNDYDDYSMEMEVLDYSDYHLLLRIDGEIKDYTYSDPDVIGSLNVENTEKYLAGYDGVFHTTGGDEDSAILTLHDYDGDAEYPENAFKEYTFADDVEFYSLDVKTSIKNEEVVSHNEDYMEIDKESAVVAMDGGSVFVWFDDDLKISKMLFYGAVVVQE